MAALELGAAIPSHGFNLFAVGQPGSGRTTLIREYLEKRAAAEPVPDDVCIVFNFADTRRPLPIRLPAGRGAPFRHQIEVLVEDAVPVDTFVIYNQDPAGGEFYIDRAELIQVP